MKKDKFYRIPNYSDYIINTNGVVINTKLKQVSTGSKNPAGYVNYRLKGDNGKTLTLGRHRLLCMVFKPLVPHLDISKLYTNHKNGIKGSDTLDNLEWVTPENNILHAEMNMSFRGRSRKRVTLIDASKKTTIFNSLTKCAKFLRCSEGTVSKSIKRGYFKEYTLIAEDISYMPIPEDKHLPFNLPSIEVNISSFRQHKFNIIQVRNIHTNEIVDFNNLKELSKFLGVDRGCVHSWFKRTSQPFVQQRYQLKFKRDPTWKNIEDINQIVFIDGRSKKPVKVIDTSTKKEIIYGSIEQCANALNLVYGTVVYRCHYPNKVWSDNRTYSYETVQLSSNR